MDMDLSGDVCKFHQYFYVYFSGIIELLVQILVSLPDSDLKKILGVILKPEMLIVMSHHNAVDIRTAVVRVIYLVTTKYMINYTMLL